MQSGIIYNADCLTGMSDIPDSAVDMVLCDLPYGTTRNKWDSVLPLDTLWSHYRRIVKPSGVVALFCDGVFMARLMLSNLDMWRYNLIWDKRRGSDYLNANIKPLKSHEEIAIFYRKKPTYNKQRWYSTPYTRTESAALSDNYGYRRRASSASLEGERNPLSILSFAHDADRAHPTQKPVKLLEWLILTYTNEQETILDNCAGSGSTCVAAIQTNRRFIGYETDTRYYEIAQARIAKAEHAQEMTRSIGGGGTDMTDAVVSALISSAVTLAVALIGIANSNRKITQKLEASNQLLLYRIGELEKKMDKHNHVIERTAVNERDIKTAYNRIDEIKTDIRELREHIAS